MQLPDTSTLLCYQYHYSQYGDGRKWICSRQHALPVIGNVDFDNDPVLIYRPDIDSTGTDQFNLVTNSDTIVVVVDALFRQG